MKAESVAKPTAMPKSSPAAGPLNQRTVRKEDAPEVEPVGKAASEKKSFRVANAHAIHCVRRKSIKFSLYLNDGVITRVVQKDRVSLADYTREIAKRRQEVFGLAAALAYTEEELSIRKSSGHASTKANGKSAASAMSTDAEADAANVCDAFVGGGDPISMDDFPPYASFDDVPSWTDGDEGRPYEEKVVPIESARSIRAEQPTWEPSTYVGRIQYIGPVNREGRKAFKTFGLELKLDSGETKEFYGYELKELQTKQSLCKGDRIQIRKGQEKFQKDTDSGPEIRTKNLYEVVVLSESPLNGTNH
ncbi:hypothetical protein [Pandoraea sp. NPDC090278]|uniref:hypothetical protein n=1 Tax=Pandoraea sp. NPDC090278 TaxID=3364391 RepID=UPI00383A2F36